MHRMVKRNVSFLDVKVITIVKVLYSINHDY